jgi:hypothetical protein
MSEMSRRLYFASAAERLPMPYVSVPVILSGWLGMYSGFVNEDGQWQLGPLREEDFPPEHIPGLTNHNIPGLNFSQQAVNLPPDGAQRVDYWVDVCNPGQMQLRWYSVKEQLPFYMEPVLIFCDYADEQLNQNGMFFGMFWPHQDEHHRLWWNVNNQGYTYDVTHWMPIGFPVTSNRKLTIIGPYHYSDGNEIA